MSDKKFMSPRERDYFDRVHTWGILWTIGAVLMLASIPVLICVKLDVLPQIDALKQVLPKLMGLYWATAVVEVIAYVPMLGAGGTYLSFVTGNISNLKLPCAIEAMERAFHIGYAMHTTAMKMCRAGVVEREIAGAIEGIALGQGAGISFTSIVSQHGETLHNHNYDGVLENGRLLLVDAGAESVENYCSDHTRTYPVSGKFTEQQRDIYNIVLAAHQQAPQNMRAGAMYMEDVHRKALLTLAEGLKGVGLINGSAEDAVAAGAMFLFMPHGLSHGMGIDVHDCEAMGERSYDFSAIAFRAAESATCIHRATWRLRAGTVMSNEPGIYFIPALIDKSKSEGLYKGIVNYDKLDGYRTFGGIRIEDDVIVTENGGRVIGGDKKIPVTVEELEDILS